MISPTISTGSFTSGLTKVLNAYTARVEIEEEEKEYYNSDYNVRIIIQITIMREGERGREKGLLVVNTNQHPTE